MTPKILIACYPNGVMRVGDVISCAMTEDGEVLAEHLSSSESWARHDMGLESDWKHDRYRERFPDGYELLWVGGDFKTNEAWLAALAKNRERHPVEAEVEVGS